ncbi:hypothetical protein Agub_g1558 [Astrephomene gubernaculifera]|uniref:Uncharacterized protein n=1 Tax=Astrephomene gubernaculifera TaxID=47775 RepID=A0AAD3DG09_9CHLO|nr:hypothetical protein Agub_g1558 [Astrephomene gubernaculifera]
MSFKRKRETAFLLSDEDPDIFIKTADKDDLLPAHSKVLGLLSKVALDLPKAAVGSQTILDLSNVTLEGESVPVSGATVRLWLDCVYACIDSSRSIKLPNSLNDAKQLLLFADYAGTADVSLIKVAGALADNPRLSLTVPMGDQGRTVDLALSGSLYYLSSNNDLHHALMGNSLAQSGTLVSAADFLPRKEQFASSLCGLLEEWLYLAGRLELVPLVQRLLDFIHTQLFPGGLSICLAAMGSVFSPRVLHAMPRQLLLESFLRQHLGCRNHDVSFTAQEREVNMLTPLSAVWFGNPCKVSAAPLDNPAEPVMVLKKPSSVVDHLAYVSVGGLRPETSNRLMQEALSKALEEQ